MNVLGKQNVYRVIQKNERNGGTKVMKSARQEKILEIIEKYEVSTQEALIGKLAEQHTFNHL